MSPVGGSLCFLFGGSPTRLSNTNRSVAGRTDYIRLTTLFAGQNTLCSETPFSLPDRTPLPATNASILRVLVVFLLFKNFSGRAPRCTWQDAVSATTLRLCAHSTQPERRQHVTELLVFPSAFSGRACPPLSRRHCFARVRQRRASPPAKRQTCEHSNEGAPPSRSESPLQPDRTPNP